MSMVQEDYSAHTRKKDADGNVKSAEVGYIVSDTNAITEDDALDLALSYARTNQPSIGDLNIASVEISERVNDHYYKVNVVYESNAFSLEAGKQSSTATMSFDCGGGSKHLTVAYSQTCKKGVGTAGDLIGWNGKTGNDQEIKGVDVPCGQLRETYTKTIRMSALNNAFKRKVAQMVGCVNDSTFKGWKAGEVMFLGCSFSGATTEKVTVTYNFAIRTEETVDMTDVQHFTKKGWEYLWVIPETAIHNGVPVTAPKEVYVATVSNTANFNELGI